MLFVILLLKFRFGPFADGGLPMAGVSREVCFYEVRVVSFDPQPPNRGARYFRQSGTAFNTGLGGPKSS